MDTVGTNSSQTTNGTTNVVSPWLYSSNYSNSTWGRNRRNLAEWISKDGNKKMFSYLTTFNLAKFLTEDPSAVHEGENNWELIIALDTWTQTFYAKTISSIDWTTNYMTCIVWRNLPSNFMILCRKIQDGECQQEEIHRWKVSWLQDDRLQYQNQSSVRTTCSFPWHSCRENDIE